MRRILDILALRLRTLFLRSRVEQELDQELRYHLDREIEENLARGMSPQDARRAAPLSLRDIEQRREECRDARGWNFTENAAKDVRFSLRQLRRDKAFTATAVLMLALGLSASAAIFAFVDAALVQPLPYRDPGRLVGVYERAQPQCLYCNLSWPDYLDWKSLNNTLEALEIYQRNGWTMSSSGGALAVRGARVSSGFFNLLGVAPALGRVFFAGEDQPGAPRTAVLSHAAWQRLFGSRPDVLGRKVLLDREPYVVVGLHGVVAYSVSRRTREIGVRMALGARAADVYRMVFRQTAWLAAAGIATGLAAGAAAARLLRGLLFGISPWDPATFAAIATLLAAAAALAAFLPARRAATVSPVDALRCE